MRFAQKLDINVLREATEKAIENHKRLDREMSLRSANAAIMAINHRAHGGDFQYQFDSSPQKFPDKEVLDELILQLSTEGFEVTDFSDATQPFISVYWGLNARPGLHPKNEEGEVDSEPKKGYWATVWEHICSFPMPR